MFMYTTWAGETVSCFNYKGQSCNTIYIQFVGRLQVQHNQGTRLGLFS